MRLRLPRLLALLACAGLLAAPARAAAPSADTPAPVPLALDAASGPKDATPLALPGLPPLFSTARNEAALTWTLPDNFAPGRYVLAFLGTEFPQPTPGHSDENEPYRLVVQRGKAETASLFTYLLPETARPRLAREDFPPLFVRPTVLAERRSAGSLELRPGDRLRLDLRRHFLVAGEVRLLRATPADDLAFSVVAAGDNPYHLFFPDTPVGFDVNLAPRAPGRWAGVLELEWTDALTGNAHREQRPVSASVEKPFAGTVRPPVSLPNGAWFLRASLLHPEAGLVASLRRHFVLGPRVDARALPDDWPLGFHHSNAFPFVPDVGLKWIRLFHPKWSVLEPAKGEYRWDEMDRIVATLRAKGQKALYILNDPPRWASSAPAEVTNRYQIGKYPVRDTRDVRDFLAAFWKRYAPGGKIDVVGAIEILNEPNTSKIYAENMAAYAELGRAVYEATQAHAPDARVVGISMSGGMHNWWAQGVLEAGLGSAMDVASVHIYETDMPRGSGVSVERKFLEFRQILRDHQLGHLPVWDTEIGFPSDIRRDGVIVPQETLNALYRQHPDYTDKVPWVVGRHWRPGSEDLGVAWTVRSTFHKLALGITKQFLFQWQGSSRFSWFYDWKEGGNVMPKLILPAHGVMAEMYRDYGQNGSEGFVPVDTGDPAWTGYAFRFRGPKGSMTVAHVFPTRAGGGAGDSTAALLSAEIPVAARVEGYQEVPLDQIDADKLHWWREKAPAPVECLVPVKASSILVADMLDRKRTPYKAAPDGRVRLPLTEHPVYILEPAP